MAGSKLVARHMKALKDIEGHRVEAGWFETDRYQAKADGSPGESVARIARIQEFGATVKTKNGQFHIPPRPFMRLAWAEFSKNRHEIQATAARKLIEGAASPSQVLNQIGLELVGRIIRSITKGNWVANSPYTVAKKGFNKPLIDTGHMRQTVNHKVIKE